MASELERGLEQARREAADARAKVLKYERELVAEKAANVDTFRGMTGAERSQLFRLDPELYESLAAQEREVLLDRLVHKRDYPWEQR